MFKFETKLSVNRTLHSILFGISFFGTCFERSGSPLQQIAKPKKRWMTKNPAFAAEKPLRLLLLCRGL